MTEPKVKLYSTPDGEDCILWSEHDLQELVRSAILEEYRYEINRKICEICEKEFNKNSQEKETNS